MRIPLLLSVFIMASSMTGSPGPVAPDPAMNGTWKTIKLEIGGTQLPPASFENQKLIIEDSNYTYIAESVDKGVVYTNGNKLDIYGRDGVNAGKHFTAIYKFEEDQLVICYNLAGDKYPEEYETKSNPAFFMAHFRKLEENR